MLFTVSLSKSAIDRERARLQADRSDQALAIARGLNPEAML